MRSGAPGALSTLAAVVVVAGTMLAVGGDASAVKLSYVSVQRGTVTAQVSAAGTVQSGSIRELSFGTSGTVTKVDVAQGQTVKAGQVLATLDSTQAAEQVNAAVAALAAANADYDQATASPSPSASAGRSSTAGGAKKCTATASSRSVSVTARPTRRPTASPSPGASASPTRSARPTTSASARPSSGGGKTCPTAKGSGSGSGSGAGTPRPSATQNRAVTEAQASASVVKAQIALNQARRALAGTKLTAPADGTVLSVAGVVGSKVSGPGSTGFVTLGDLNELQVQADFSQSDVARLKVGQDSKITLPAGNGGPYGGSVAHIDPSATTSGSMVQYGVMIAFNDRPGNLLVGQSATVVVTTDEAQNALTVPPAALHTGPTGIYVLVKQGGSGTRVQPVTVGLRGDTVVQILTGLHAGQKVKIA